MVADNTASIRVFLINGQRCVLWGLERLIEAQQPAMQVAGTAQNCADAFRRINATTADLVLLDVDSDDEDSLAMIAELKARSGSKILVLTGSRDHSMYDAAVVAGANGVVRKESPAEGIISAIKRVHGGELWLDRAAMSRVIGELCSLKSPREADPDQARIERLTARERQIVELSADHPGTNATLLAQMLNVSQHTLRNHCTSIYEKLGVRSRIGMLAFAQKHGLASDPRASRPGSRSSLAAANHADRGRSREMIGDNTGGEGILAPSSHIDSD